MDRVDRYCKLVQKRTKRLLRRVFGYSTIAEGCSNLKNCENYISSVVGKNIDCVSYADVRNSGICYVFSKYKTLKRILDLYLDSVCLQNFIKKGE